MSPDGREFYEFALGLFMAMHWETVKAQVFMQLLEMQLKDFLVTGVITSYIKQSLQSLAVSLGYALMNKLCKA